jgi:cellobiose-specific phosphotransferase system component IIB
MKKIVLACAIGLSTMFSLSAIAAPQYTTEETVIGDLIDNP